MCEDTYVESPNTYGDQHLLKQSTGNSTTSVLQMILADLPLSTFFIPRTKLLNPTKPMKHG